MITLLGESAKSVGNEIFVDDDSYYIRDGTAEHPYETVQYAIDAAEPGDTIYVFGGIYNESLSINKELTLMGSIEDGNSVIYYRTPHKYTIEITADNVNLTDFFIKDDNNYIISYIQGALVRITADNVIINRNTISNCKNGWGIDIDSSDGHLIRDNIIDNMLVGVYAESSKTDDFVGNAIKNCESYGVKLESSDEIRFHENEIQNGKYGVHSTDCENLNFSKNAITDNQLYGIALYDSDNGIIKKNEISYNGAEGIHLDSDDYKVKKNAIIYNQIGINLMGLNCEIFSNSFNRSDVNGIYANSQSRGNKIYLNTFYKNYLNARENGHNTWDNYDLEKGNYWDDYNEIDKYPKDGIGDTSYTTGGVMDRFPIGKFLEPPNKPSNPSPVDGKANVGLKITLKTKVTDPDNDLLTVSFYRVHNITTNEIELISIVKNVPSGDTASCNFNLNFDTTFAWFVNVTDGKLFNISDTWFFYTRARPADNDPPVAVMGVSSNSVKENEEITFDASGSYDPDPKGKIEFYRWNFGDNTSEIISVDPSHSYKRAGNYKVYLTVIDNFGTSSQTSATIYVKGDEPVGNLKPIADISAPSSGKVGAKLTFDGSDSNDPDNTDEIESYHWDFGDGKTAIGETVQHTYNSVGTYTVTLTVTDDEGSGDNESVTITIKASSSSDGTPGFDVAIVLIAFASIIFYMRRKRK